MPLNPPPRPDLPLTALRAFEAAARLGGFRAAAEELGVSAAAVSAQVKGLEDRLGHALFVRGARGVALTEAGALARPGLSAAFRALEAAQAAMLAGGGRALEVVALPAIAQLWLPSRLARAEAAGHRVSVTAMEAMPRGKRARFDLALFYGPGADVLLPVAAPGVTGPRLSDAAWARDWVTWAEACGDAVPPAGRRSRSTPWWSRRLCAARAWPWGAGPWWRRWWRKDGWWRSGRGCRWVRGSW
ncbi:MAG: LysR family transcriptional regulator [Pseudomonadota bacterium]